MNKIYTHQDVSQFFHQFKELPNSYEFNKVHQLINNPNARARQRVNFSRKPFKIITMTSAFIAGTAALMLWLSTEKTIVVASRQALKMQDSNQISISGARTESITPHARTHKENIDIALTPEVENSPGFSGTNVTYKNVSQIQWPADSVIGVEKSVIMPAVQELKNPGVLKDGLHLIELSKPELQKLGIIFADSGISYDNRLFELNLFKKGQGITMRKDTSTVTGTASHIFINAKNSTRDIHYKPINLVYLSDEFGEQNIKWITDLDDEDKNTREYFKNKSQFLIPILLRKSDYPDQMCQNQIFWFEPTAALFDSLPESIGHQLALEYNYVKADKNEKLHLPASSCVYFEACKSTLEIDDFMVYPNPAQLNATIDFTLSKLVSGWISLVSISGSELKFLVPATTFSEGKNSFTIDVSDILPGIYLIYLSTGKGFFTQRLIISR
jgi:hypothetical protein